MKSLNAPKTKFKVTILWFTCCMVLASRSGAASINFNDGTTTAPIGSFYQGQGLTFFNASWRGPVPNQTGTPSSGLFLADVTDNGFNPPYTPDALTPIVGVFSTPQMFISILAVDVGIAGARLNVYDAASGGNLLASDTFFGLTNGLGTFHTLMAASPGILRFELYQPTAFSNEGVFFDNLTFSPVPEPTMVVLFTSGVFFVTAYRLVRRVRGAGETSMLPNQSPQRTRRERRVQSWRLVGRVAELLSSSSSSSLAYETTPLYCISDALRVTCV